MKYFFILGNNTTLSLAELFSIIKFEIINFENNILIIEPKQKIKPPDLIKRIGGTIKIGEVISEADNDYREIFNLIKNEISIQLGQKFRFGFSNYSNFKINTKKLGMDIKRYIKERGVNSRMVVSREKILSSVVVEQNKLISNGIEIIFVQDAKKLLIGRTQAVQAFKELSFRDYGRPERDDRSGMLPPKLAQIMINLSQAKSKDVILDPFCGSGTIITEAMILGYKNLIGTDILKKAVDDTKKNINWLEKKFGIKNAKCKIENYPVQVLGKKLEKNSVDKIVTEPFLGEQRNLDVKKEIVKLEKLYTVALKEFDKVLKPGGKIVMLFPVFFNKHFINPNLRKFKIINPIPKEFGIKNLKFTNRNTIVYGRQGQRVWREVVVLAK